ncbi:hypothetical protein ART_0694 [Arthrobacter sp. PAMC 25486]|nr:hypothetical protein ART_0694 [Arthrobacter sp. PAMC 25486]
MTVQTVRFVLRQHHNFQISRICQIGQSEIDQPEPGERNSWFSAVCCQGHQSFTLTAC